MTPELFTSMVQSWYEVYAPVVQACSIGMLVASMFISIGIFLSLLLRNWFSPSMRTLS